MKCAATAHEWFCALCFMFAKQTLHASASECLISQSDASLKNSMCCDILNQMGSDVIRNDKLSVQSMDFAVSIINLVKQLKEKRESIISNQIGRSGTSIGTNIREAQYAQILAGIALQDKLHIRYRL